MEEVAGKLDLMELYGVRAGHLSMIKNPETEIGSTLKTRKAK